MITRSWTRLQDFASIDEARALMEAPERHALALHGEILKLEYSIAPQPAAAAGGGGGGRGLPGAPLDWVCSMCQAVNFSRHVSPTANVVANSLGLQHVPGLGLWHVPGCQWLKACPLKGSCACQKVWGLLHVPGL